MSYANYTKGLNQPGHPHNHIKAFSITIFALSIGTPYHTCPKIKNSPLYYLMMCLKLLLYVWQPEQTYRTPHLQCLIWVFTVCKGLAVPILIVIMVYTCNLKYPVIL